LRFEQSGERKIIEGRLCVGGKVTVSFGEGSKTGRHYNRHSDKTEGGEKKPGARGKSCYLGPKGGGKSLQKMDKSGSSRKAAGETGNEEKNIGS